MTSAPVTDTDAAWLLGLLQAGDSFYPTGSYAHSFGLEGLVQQGVVRDRATLRDFIVLSALPALRHTDLPLAAHAWGAFGEANWPRIGELCVLSSALKTAREARAASENIGRQRAELMASLRIPWPKNFFNARPRKTGRTPPPFPPHSRAASSVPRSPPCSRAWPTRRLPRSFLQR